MVFYASFINSAYNCTQADLFKTTRCWTLSYMTWCIQLLPLFTSKSQEKHIFLKSCHRHNFHHCHHRQFFHRMYRNDFLSPLFAIRRIFGNPAWSAEKCFICRNNSSFCYSYEHLSVSMAYYSSILYSLTSFYTLKPLLFITELRITPDNL